MGESQFWFQFPFSREHLYDSISTVSSAAAFTLYSWGCGGHELVPRRMLGNHPIDNPQVLSASLTGSVQWVLLSDHKHFHGSIQCPQLVSLNTHSTSYPGLLPSVWMVAILKPMPPFPKSTHRLPLSSAASLPEVPSLFFPVPLLYHNLQFHIG